MPVNIKDINKTLAACLKARIAIDSATRAYEDAKILADNAKNVMSLAEQAVRDAAKAAAAQAEAKVEAVVAMEQGMEDMISVIKSAGNIKGKTALDTCLAARAAINTVAQKADELKNNAERAAELSSIADAALRSAQGDWMQQQTIYEDMVANAETARDAVLSVAKIKL